MRSHTYDIVYSREFNSFTEYAKLLNFKFVCVRLADFEFIYTHFPGVNCPAELSSCCNYNFRGRERDEME